ncbi:MAG TPA: GNAT family N-acetyltransferase [Phycisphaerae bacterium]|nr:GNAT family N-acetyltransferase [Phycisphaerae bacterium]
MSAWNWTIRPASAGETPRVLELVRAVHGDRYPELDARYWRWRYYNDAGYGATVFVAELDGQPIGLRPVALFDYRWGTQALRGAMYTGVLTHPAHRRKGVFRSLVNAANAYVAEAGAAFAMTLPNDASLPGFRNASDWVFPGLIPVYVKLLDARRVLAARLTRPLAALLGPVANRGFGRAAPPDPAVTTACVSTLPDAIDAVAADFARDAGTLMIARPAAFWNWRYAAHPHIAYDLIVAHAAETCLGAVATAVNDRYGAPAGMIVDIAARDREAGLAHLLGAAERHLVDRGAALITCQATTPLLQRALRRCGYRRLPARLAPKKFNFVYRLTGAAPLHAEPRRLEDWHLMFGDSDNA